MSNIRRELFVSLVLGITAVESINMAAQAGFIRVTEVQARQAVAAAVAAAKGDENVFGAKFDEEIKKINPEYEARRYPSW